MVLGLGSLPPTWESWLLTLAWASPDCHENLGSKQSDRSLFLSLSLSLFTSLFLRLAFQIKIQKYFKSRRYKLLSKKDYILLTRISVASLIPGDNNNTLFHLILQ